VQQRIVPTGGGSFVTLGLGAGEPYLVRQDLATADSKRAKKRRSLAYFGQLSDFQLADEESPGRVEFLDPPNGTQLPFNAAWRPWEALEPQIDDAAIRQLDAFAAASPITQGNGARRKMDFALDTGDSADSQQLNETEWVRTLLEGGALNPNSGINPVGYLHQLCPPVGVPGAYPGPSGTGFWSIRTAAEADWPQQNRLLEVMDNRNGTLSIFGTILDHASAATAPASGTSAAGITPADLASVGRTLSYNDPQVGATKCSPNCGEGTSDDRNVELLIRDSALARKAGTFLAGRCFRP
jgi:hypothetical protein